MTVTVTTDSPNIVFGNNQPQIAVVVDLKKDGIDGKSAYELAVEQGYTGSLSDFTLNLIETDVDFSAYYILAKN